MSFAGSTDVRSLHKRAAVGAASGGVASARGIGSCSWATIPEAFLARVLQRLHDEDRKQVRMQSQCRQFSCAGGGICNWAERLLHAVLQSMALAS